MKEITWKQLRDEVNAIPHVRSDAMFSEDIQAHMAFVYYYVKTQAQLKPLLVYYNRIKRCETDELRQEQFELPCMIGFEECEETAYHIDHVDYLGLGWKQFVLDVADLAAEQERGADWLTYCSPFDGSKIPVQLRVRATTPDDCLRLSLLHAEGEDKGLPFALATVANGQLPTYRAAIKNYSENQGMVTFLVENNVGKVLGKSILADGPEVYLMEFDPQVLKKQDPSGCTAYEDQIKKHKTRKGKVPAFQIKSDKGKRLAVLRADLPFDAVNMYLRINDPEHEERFLHADPDGDGWFITKMGKLQAELVEGSV